ncbi:hypothetical protein [Thiorhodococcus minor]|uniref:Uncharacterized protein n=1 Tax=Thiorhodococcus minor TaxID=57489 RepID=A0A6M0K2U2_9GAMM|nr:hypothetical protein [Thiorhodococcus minor]NEV63709.1 hypothetical protein [Thiorhodococcus minor]
MSAVLWANLLVDGKVRSDQSDHLALYKHSKKLDGICRKLGLASFAAVCDTTDARVSLGELAMPDGMASTDELMAAQGQWMPVEDASAMLEGLRTYVRENAVRFGVLGDQRDQVLAELAQVIAFVETEGEAATGFNFAVVI